MLAFASNAGARAHLRSNFKAAYAELVELSFNQRDVESCAPPIVWFGVGGGMVLNNI